MRQLFVMALAGMYGSCLGCTTPTLEPETVIRYSGWSGFKFYDSKDNDISVDELTVDPNTKVGTIKGLKIRNNSSDPQAAYVNQQAMWVEGQRVNQMIVAETLAGLNQMTASIVGALPGIYGARAAAQPVKSPDLTDALVPLLMRAYGNTPQPDVAAALKVLGHEAPAVP